MTLRSALTWLVAAAAVAAPAAAEPLDTGTVLLTLEGGAGTVERPGRTFPADMELEFTCRAGRWDEEVWGYAVWFGRAHHVGRVTAMDRRGDRTRLAVDLTLGDGLRVPGGPADYRIDLARVGNAFTGTYTGTVVGRKVQGKATARMMGLLVRGSPGFVGLRAGEHPRLIFRKGDLPALRKRMATPEGKAILEMLQTRSPLRYPQQVTDRRASWMAANWGAIHQLTGDAGAAAKARRIVMDQVVKRPVPLDRSDIQQAPRLLGVALAYDLCRDAWDMPFRALITEYLRRAADDLYRGVVDGVAMSEQGPGPAAAGSDSQLVADPWRHQNAIRMACVGCAAIALIGEKGADGKEIPEAPRLARIAERDVLLYLRWGLAASGGGMEGAFAKDFALANGVLQFLQADRVALGRDLAEANPFLLAGHVLEAMPAADGAWDLGISSISIQAAGRWPMGLGSAPAALLPALKWCFDRDVGLAGQGHFDCTWPYHAAYALANYPFDVPARPPGEVLPLLVPDPGRGRCVFRNRWHDAADILATLNLRAMPLPGLHGRDVPPAGHLRIVGLGRTWVDGVIGLAPGNTILGARNVRCELPRAGQAIVACDLSGLYLKDVTDRRPRRRRKGQPPPPLVDPEVLAEPDVVQFPCAIGAFRDTKVTCERHVAIDYSGVCGAPALFVLIDRIANAREAPWDLRLRARFARDGSFALSAGREDRSRGAAPAPAAGAGSLTGRIVAPAGARGTRLAGSDAYFVVFTIQSGAAPRIEVEGEGLAAKVRVGDQTVWFRDGRIVLAK